MKTLSKKLLSLLLVAVMLVAAMPFAAFADGGEKTNVTVVGLSNGAVIYKTTLETMREDFDTANKEHLRNAFLYGKPSYEVDTDTIVSGSYDADANQLNRDSGGEGCSCAYPRYLHREDHRRCFRYR